METILITGATGHLGKAVINELVSRDQIRQLSAMVRDLSKPVSWKRKASGWFRAITIIMIPSLPPFRVTNALRLKKIDLHIEIFCF